MVNPYNERLEAIEHDLFKNKEAISKLTEQVKGAKIGLLESFRSIAALNINLYIFWASYLLKIESRNNPSCKEDADLCLSFAREHGGEAKTEIKHSNNPEAILDDWIDKCKEYFSKHGGFDMFEVLAD